MSASTENLQHQAEHARIHRRTPVFAYLTTLFAVAFLMLLLAYFQQHRANQESTNALKASASAVTSINGLIADNEQLRTQLEEAESKLEKSEKGQEEMANNLQTLITQRQDAVNATNAMQWFWQIESAYVKENYGTARELVKQFEETGLSKCLPSENTTGTQRFSPAARYQEIYDVLF